LEASHATGSAGGIWSPGPNALDWVAR
jgi:hypothetical protein